MESSRSTERIERCLTANMARRARRPDGILRAGKGAFQRPSATSSTRRTSGRHTRSFWQTSDPQPTWEEWLRRFGIKWSIVVSDGVPFHDGRDDGNYLWTALQPCVCSVKDFLPLDTSLPGVLYLTFSWWGLITGTMNLANPLPRLCRWLFNYPVLVQ